MTYEEALIAFKKKRLWVWSKVLAVIIVIANFVIYLVLHLQNGSWQSFTHRDIQELKALEFSYEFPWWSNLVFCFLWLAFFLGVHYYLYLRWFKCERALYKPCHLVGEKRSAHDQELKDRMLIYDFYKVSNFGGAGLWLLAAVYYGGALYGLVVNIAFGIFSNLLAVGLIIIWNILLTIYEFFFARGKSL